MSAVGFSSAVVQFPCVFPDCHPYTMTQGTCKEVIEVANNDCNWYSGLSPYTDFVLLGGRIAAYKIKWVQPFPNAPEQWSEWFVPGVNDISPEIRTSAASCFQSPDVAGAGRKQLIRWWSYFYDHDHKYIICFDS